MFCKRLSIICFVVFAFLSEDVVYAQNLSVEANDFKQQCYNNMRFRGTFDCECLASAYEDKLLELRVDSTQKGQVNRSNIVGPLTRNSSCVDAGAVSKNEYANCIRRYVVAFEDQKLVDKGISQDEFCSCYAEKYSESLSSYAGKLDSNSMSSMKFKARLYCKKNLLK